MSRSPWPLRPRDLSSLKISMMKTGTVPMFQNFGALAHLEVRGLLRVALSEHLPSLLAVSPGVGRAMGTLPCEPSLRWPLDPGKGF